MKTIKFRGKKKYDGIWAEGDLKTAVPTLKCSRNAMREARF